MVSKNLLGSCAAAVLLVTGTFASGQTLINGAGATFPAPIYLKWFSDFHKAHPDVQINYQALGSGAGITQVTEGTVDFGASDGPMNDHQLKNFQDKRGFGILHFPTVLGATVVTYNIPGVTENLNFTPEALAGIYLGKITKWNDSAIAKENPKAKLPAEDIVVVHRAENSGTTYNWTDYLSSVSPEWKSKVGRGTGVNWPTGLGAKGSDGVTGQVQQTKYSVGYVELNYALTNHLGYGNVKNSSGAFVKPTLASITAAAAAAAKDMPADFRVSIVNPAGKDAYPIATFTWLLIPSEIKDSAKLKALKEFMDWYVAGGQNEVEALSYARLPKNVVDMEKKAFAQVGGGKSAASPVKDKKVLLARTK